MLLECLTHKNYDIQIQRMQRSLPGYTGSVYRQQPAERSCFDSEICHESLSIFVEPDQSISHSINILVLGHDKTQADN